MFLWRVFVFSMWPTVRALISWLEKSHWRSCSPEHGPRRWSEIFYLAEDYDNEEPERPQIRLLCTLQLKNRQYHRSLNIHMLWALTDPCNRSLLQPFKGRGHSHGSTFQNAIYFGIYNRHPFISDKRSTSHLLASRIVVQIEASFCPMSMIYEARTGPVEPWSELFPTTSLHLDLSFVKGLMSWKYTL